MSTKRDGWWVEGFGPKPCRLMVVAEAPAATEVRTGEPLTGRTGKEYDNLMRRIVGLDPDTVYKSNVFKYQLPKNKEYHDGELTWMMENLYEEVREVDPEIILALGAISTHAFLGDKYDMETMNALPHRWSGPDGKVRTVIPSFHPAAGFRDGAAYQFVVEAFECVRMALRGHVEYVGETKPVKVLPFRVWRTPILDDSDYLLAMDTETLKTGRPYMVTWTHQEGYGCYAYANDDLRELRDHVEDDHLIVLLHNAPFDLPILWQLGIRPHHWIDTMQMAFLLQSLPLGLKGLAYRLCGLRMREYEEVMKEYGAEDLSQVPEEARLAYACADPDATLRIFPKMMAMSYPRMREVLERDCAIQPMIIAMMQRGFPCSYDVLKGLDDEFTNMNLETWCMIEEAVRGITDKVDVGSCPEDEARIVKNIRKKGFNPASAKQVAYLLYDKMGVGSSAKLRKSRWGKTTESKALKRLASESPLIPMITQWKERDTLIDKSLRQLPKYIRRDGKIHTKISMIRVKHSGRLASSSPNLMAQPNRTDEYLKIRKAFSASDGYTLLSYDFSQIELRVLAHLSQDTPMLDVFMNGRDLHTQNHIDVFGRPDKTHEERVMIKKTGFGIAYLISGRGLSELLLPISPRFTEYLCQDYIDTWFKKHPGVTAYVQKTFAEARRYGRVVDMFGRMEYIPECRSVYPEIRDAGLRKAVNMKIQGTAQGIIKEAMRQMLGTVGGWMEEGLVFPILQVHDDLIFEARDEVVEEVAPVIKNYMENCVELCIPIKVDEKRGKVWGEMEKVGA